MKIPTLNAKVGAMNRLRVVSCFPRGVYLDGKNLDEILLPQRYVPEGCEVGDFLDVFIYLDSEDRLVATTETPYGMVGELAYLEVVSVNNIGAFVDWGLPKDLLIPFREQREGLDRGRRYIVHIYFDKSSERLVGSTKIHKYINPKSIQYSVGDPVDLVVCSPFELGYTVIIDKRFVGVIYQNEIFQPVEEGQSLTGYIKNIRPDGKIDAELQRSGDGGRDGLADLIIERLKAADGFLPLTDKTPPEQVYDQFKVSKRVFKRVLGNLYKRRRISIDDDGIRLTES